MTSTVLDFTQELESPIGTTTIVVDKAPDLRRRRG